MWAIAAPSGLVCCKLQRWQPPGAQQPGRGCGKKISFDPFQAMWGHQKFFFLDSKLMICGAANMSIMADRTPDRFQCQAGTKVQLLENVLSGTIQKCTIEALANQGLHTTKNLHCNTDDTGFGGARRFRGWRLAWKQPFFYFRSLSCNSFGGNPC